MAFAVLYLPLVDEFRASRADVAAVQSAVLLLTGFAGPIVGWAFDRLGPRRLHQSAAVLGALAFVAASRATSLPALVVTYGLIGGLMLAALGGQTNMVVAALWYPRARGRAIALVDLGTGFGAFCVIPLGQLLVTAIGWRGTLLVWAVLLLAIVVPLNGFQRLPPSSAPTKASPDAARAWSVRTAVRASAFWWLAVAVFCGSCAFPVMNTHMVAYAVERGITPDRAAAALGAVSLVSLVGRYGTGWLSDRIGRAVTLTLAYGSAALGVVCLSMLALTGRGFWLVLYVVLYGLAQGSTGIVSSARAADVFAGASFGTIFGWITLAIGPSQALGAWIGGRIFDVTASYLPAFGFAIAALVAGVLAMWQVHEAKTPRQSDDPLPA